VRVVCELSRYVAELQNETSLSLSLKEQSISELSRRITELETEMQHLHVTAATAASEADAAAQAAHEQHVLTVTALHDDIQAREQHQQVLEAQLQQAVIKYEETQAALSAAEDGMAVLECARLDLERRVMSLESTVSSQAVVIGDKDSEIQSLMHDLQCTQQALSASAAQKDDVTQLCAALTSQLEDAKAQYKAFSDKTKAKIEQKDQAIDALTGQISQHIGTIAEMQQQQEQLQAHLSNKSADFERVESQLKQEASELKQQLEYAGRSALQQQEQHAAHVAEYDAQIACIQSMAESQLEQERCSAAAAAADAAALTQNLNAQLQSTMQALSDAEKVMECNREQLEVQQQRIQQQEQHASQLQATVNDQRSSIAELENMLHAAAQEAAAQQEEAQQLARCLDAAGDIGAMKDEKCALLSHALENTEQLLQERDALLNETACSLAQSQETVSSHTSTIAQLQASVSELEGRLAAAEASSMQLQSTLQQKQAEFDAALQGEAAVICERDEQLQAARDTCDELKSAVALLQQELDCARDACKVMEHEQEALVLCVAAAEDVIALKDEKVAAFQEQLLDTERLFEAAAQAAAELEQELEQVTGLADVTQLQLDTATAEAETAAREHHATAAQLAAAVASCERLQLDVTEWSTRLQESQTMVSELQQCAAAAEAAACAQRQVLSECVAAKECDLAAERSRADALAASVERLQQLLRDVQDSASAAEQRSNIAEELAREMYTHTHASVSVKAASSSGSDDVVHELRGQVAALNQELQERAKEQMEWLQEMDGLRRMIQVGHARARCF
jgi:chromosome segregation ATPase